MESRALAFVALFALTGAGCTSQLFPQPPALATGDLTFLALGTRAPQGITVAEEVVGVVCLAGVVFDYEAAVDDALGKAPGANALADAEFEVRANLTQTCTVVRRQAVRLP